MDHYTGKMNPRLNVQAGAIVVKSPYSVFTGTSLWHLGDTITSSATITRRHHIEPLPLTREIRLRSINKAPVPKLKRQRCSLNQSIPSIGSAIWSDTRKELEISNPLRTLMGTLISPSSLSLIHISEPTSLLS